MAYKHGVYVREQETSLAAPVTGSAGLNVIIGTAPINTVENPAAAVNTPVIAYTYKEAVEKMGYSDDFASYTLCEAISAAFSVIGVAPIVMINVLDPEKHSADIETKNVNVVNGMAKITEKGILLDQLVVKANSSPINKDTDYTTTWDNDGSLNIIINKEGAASDASTLELQGKKIDPKAVKAADIVGGIELSSGKETGLEVIRQVYPKLGVVPGIITAPRFSKDPTVSAALQAKTNNINGVFNCTAFIDIDCSATGAKRYDGVKAQKEKQGLTNPNAYAVWLYGKVGENIYSGSTLAAIETAYVDAVNDDTPNVSPSNKPLTITASCLEDGTEVLLDQEQANAVNAVGVATLLNMEGFRIWGNNTVAYPANSDPKDRWLSIRRFFNWTGNNFIRTYFKEVDNPANPRLIEKIVDSENIKGNGYVARGICARYEITFDASENPLTELLNGALVFHQYLTPYGPAESITNVLEFDPNALNSLYA